MAEIQEEARMSTDSIFESVRNILVDQLSVYAEVVTMDSNLIDDLNAD